MRKLIIKTFAHLFNRDAAIDDGDMPNHIWTRWYGPNACYYNRIWDKFDFDNDEDIFTDWSFVFIDFKKGKTKLLDSLPKKRFKNLYKFSWRMLLHYLLVTTKCTIIEIIVNISYFTFFNRKPAE